MHRHIAQLAEAGAALIGDEIDGDAAPDQCAGQGFRREQMSPGPARRQHDARVPVHRSVLPGKRLRVRASSMPAPKAIATIDDPP